MNYNTKLNEELGPLQIKVFSRWVSTHLKSIPNSDVLDVTKDLSDGVKLIELAEVLTHKKATRLWEHKPTLKVENVQNCDLALNMFSNDGVKLVGISGKDISDNNKKLILGLIWSLILHYSVDHSANLDDIITSKINNLIKSESDPRNELISWAVNRTRNYNNVNDFQPYDLAMCALLDSYYPDKIQFKSLNPDDHQHNAKLAFDVMNELGIICYIYPEDLPKNENKVDRMALVTQLSAVKSVLDNVIKSGLIKNAESKVFVTTEEQKVKDEEAKIRAKLEGERKLAQKKNKGEDDIKLKGIEDARMKFESILQSKHNENKIKNEFAKVKEEKEKIAKESIDRIKEDEDLKRKIDEQYRAKVENEIKHIDMPPSSSDIDKIKDDAENRVKLAEARVEAAEKEKKELEAKLKAAEKALVKANHQNESQSKDDGNNHHHKKNYRIKIHIHPHENAEAKKYKVEIKLKNHENDNSEHKHHIAVKNVHVVERKNGKVVPTEVEGEKVGEKQIFHVKEV